MIIIDLKYIVPLTEIDAHMTAHMKFLNKYYAKNIFIASGRKIPRTGGIILAVGITKEEADKIIAEDPFHHHGLAEFTVTEFQTSQMRKELKGILS